MVGRTYHITPEILGESKQRACLRIVSSAGKFAVLYFLLELLWHGTGPFSVISSLVGSIVTGILFAVTFYFLFLRPNMHYDLIVSDDSILAIYQFAERSVRKGEVSTVREYQGNVSSFAGLRVSRFGRVGMFFRGFVWVPKSMPEYDSLKGLAESWKMNP
jgi:hypothetical protein